MSNAKRRRLTCCVCGKIAGLWYQHWNRDNGWGICADCACAWDERDGRADLLRSCGQPGENFDGRLLDPAACVVVGCVEQYLERDRFVCTVCQCTACTHHFGAPARMCSPCIVTSVRNKPKKMRLAPRPARQGTRYSPPPPAVLPRVQRGGVK